MARTAHRFKEPIFEQKKLKLSQYSNQESRVGWKSIDKIIEDNTKNGSLKEWWNNLSREDKDLVIYYRKGKTLLRKLFFQEPKLDFKNIAEIMTKNGYSMSGERVRQIINNLYSNRLTRSDKKQELKKQIKEYFKQHSTVTKLELAKKLGITIERVSDLANELNLQFTKKYEQEIEERINTLTALDLKIPRSMLKGNRYLPSKEKAIKRYAHMLEEYDFEVPCVIPFLTCDSSTIDRGIKILTDLQLDWKDPKYYWLLGRKKETILDAIKVFESIGADKNLYYLIRYPIVKLYEIFNGNIKYKTTFDAIQNLEKKGSLEYLTNVAIGLAITANFRNKSGVVKNKQNIRELAIETTYSVLATCKTPKNNPAAFLAILTYAINFEIKELLTNNYRFNSENEYDPLPDPESGRQPKLKLKDKT